MNIAQLLTWHLKEFISGNSMAGAYLKQHLNDISMDEVITQIGNLNTIAVLVYHINYYVEAQLKVLQGGPLNAKDYLSFDLQPIEEEVQWETLRSIFYKNLELYTKYVSDLTEKELKATFVLEQYGSYHRNIMGLLEHSHYHFGQIVLLKKIIRSKN